MIEDTELLQKAKDNDNVVDILSRSSTQALSMWKNYLTDELDLILNNNGVEYEHEGEIAPLIIMQAKRLIHEIPMTVSSPEIGINCDGTLLLEWSRREHDDNLSMFSIILNGRELIISFMLHGVIKHYQSGLDTSHSVKTILGILSNHFEQDINDGKTHRI